MRVLFVTNYYPPTALGGYEMWCQEVAQRLVARGHQVCVVTSQDHNAAAIEDGVDVRRALDLEVRGGTTSTLRRALGRQARASRNVVAIEQIVAELDPGAALLWGMWNLPRETAKTVETLLGGRASYYFCDYWTTLPASYLQQLSAPARTLLGRLVKQIVAAPVLRSLRSDARVALDLPNAMCTSHAVKRKLLREGVAIADAEVIHGGVCTERFHPEPAESAGDRLRLLYLGRIEADKGVHTAVEAMRIAARTGVLATLDIYGRGDADFVEELESSVARHGLGKRVSLRGSVTASSTPALLRSYDALVFPSEWDEPFARTVLEAMASGLAVIGTTTGGTGEILKDGETGLAFQAGAAGSLAAAIQKLASDPELVRTLGATARRVVAAGYDISRMVDRIERKLETISSRRDASAPRPVAVAARPELNNARAQIRAAHS